MKIFTSKKVQEIDKYTIENEPILSINLMERAAKNCTEWIIKKFTLNKKIKILVGPGNNGGDALAIARMLIEKRYNVKIFVFIKKLSIDSQINYDRLVKQNTVTCKFIDKESDFPKIDNDDIIIDGLFGSGLSRPLKGFFEKLVKHVNSNKATIVSIDIPSGLFSENNSLLVTDYDNSYKNAIKADYTITLELPFLSFMFPDTEKHVGELNIIPIGLHKEIIKITEAKYHYLSSKCILKRLIKRTKFSHKGTFGHALLLAGSYGKMGAAILASKACLRSGVGLLTVHVPITGYEIMQISVPEAMVCIDESGTKFCKLSETKKYNAIGVGPGIGMKQSTQQLFKGMLEKIDKPIVIDADAINILAENKSWIKLLPKNSIITPHPKEFERLVGKSANYYKRLLLQIEFAIKYQVILLVKGANTSIACPDGKCYFNSTGNNGMATAGSGDVLTGIILSLLAQGYSAKDASIVGVYIHGLSADIAVKQKSKQALIASDIIGYLGNVFIELNKM